MKKFCTIVLMLAMLLCLSACFPETPGPTNPTDGGGDTHTVYLLQSQFTDYAGEALTDIRSERVYDENGILTELIQYMDGEDPIRSQIVCDEAGRILSATGGGIREDYTYDERGNLILLRQSADDTVTLEYSYTYNAENILISTTMTLGETAYRSDYTLDENGWRIREDTFFNDVFSGYTLYTNDEQGRAVSGMTFTAEDALVETVRTTYEGNTVTSTICDSADVELMRQVTVYDENGNQQSMSVYSFGELYYTVTSTYLALEVSADSPLF